MDAFLEKIMRRCGAYYHSGSLFYQELWRQRLVNIGFRVISVEKLQWHDVWEIRLCGSLSAQIHLLVSKPSSAKLACSNDPLAKQLELELHEIAKDLGLALKKDHLTVVRTGKYFKAALIWRLGTPGRLLKQEKKPEGFSFLIRAWLHKSRN